jgi:hypothetical protein
VRSCGIVKSVRLRVFPYKLRVLLGNNTNDAKHTRCKMRVDKQTFALSGATCGNSGPTTIEAVATGEARRVTGCARRRCSSCPGSRRSDGDLADQANADAEAELHIRLHQGDVRLLRAIEDALARISHDTFGVCEVCKRDISKARLEAVP